jgi:hypothetical protein
MVPIEPRVSILGFRRKKNSSVKNRHEAELGKSNIKVYVNSDRYTFGFRMQEKDI